MAAFHQTPNVVTGDEDDVETNSKLTTYSGRLERLLWLAHVFSTQFICSVGSGL